MLGNGSWKTKPSNRANWMVASQNVPGVPMTLDQNEGTTQKLSGRPHPRSSFPSTPLFFLTGSWRPLFLLHFPVPSLFPIGVKARVASGQWHPRPDPSPSLGTALCDLRLPGGMCVPGASHVLTPLGKAGPWLQLRTAGEKLGRLLNRRLPFPTTGFLAACRKDMWSSENWLVP